MSFREQRAAGREQLNGENMAARLKASKPAKEEQRQREWACEKFSLWVIVELIAGLKLIVDYAMAMVIE